MYAHRPYFAIWLYNDDAYDRRLDTYFVREGIKRKSEKADLETMTREEYTLDWW